ncbi:MAG: NAD(P)-binding protein [bacterium]|nr:NAD(P)-binding protein [bacterium]
MAVRYIPLSRVMKNKKDNTVLIAGAGLCGLSAAYHLCKKGFAPVIISPREKPGGILGTAEYGANVFDIYPKNLSFRFPESSKILRDLYPKGIKTTDSGFDFFTAKGFKTYPGNLVSAIRLLGVPKCFSLFLKKSADTGGKNSLEHFESKQCGKGLYALFIKPFLEKVFGAPCGNLTPFLWMESGVFPFSTGPNGFPGGNKPSYPDNGPVPLAEKLFLSLRRKNVKFVFETGPEETEISQNAITRITFGNNDYFPRRMILAYPAHRFIKSVVSLIPQDVRDAAATIRTRNLICAHILINGIPPPRSGPVFISEPGIGASMVHFICAGKKSACSGMTLLYFCDSEDALWAKSDEEIINNSVRDLKSIALAEPKLLIGGSIQRFEQALPVRETGYEEKITLIKNYLNRIENMSMCEDLPIPGLADYEISSGVKAAESAIKAM